MFRRTSFILSLISLQQLSGQPQGCRTIAGQAVEMIDQRTMIIQTQDRAVLQWKSFSNNPQEITRFVQPSRDSIVLNRVVGKEMSSLLGRLESNGQIYLINRNGILFGKDAVIECAAFLASTLDVSNDLFLQNKQLLFEGDSTAAITNLGTVQANIGAVHLLGYAIENLGSITSPQEVGLFAGTHILLQPEKSHLLYIASSNPDIKKQIQASGPHHLGINLQGAITALSIEESHGRVYLKSDHDLTIGKQAKVEADRISIETAGGILYNEGKLSAAGGQIDLQVAYNVNDPKPVYQLGTLDVSGIDAGNIKITAPKYYNHGSLLAKSSRGIGGTVSIHTKGCYQESSTGTIDVSGQTGGWINIKVDDGQLFTSGTHRAIDGKITHLARQIALVAATLDAGATGRLQVGDAKTERIILNPFTKLSALLGADPSLILQSGQLIDPNAGGGTDFGVVIVPLSTGNVVIGKDQDDFGGSDAGAVYLYNGATSALISTVTGSNANDFVGADVLALTGNGNFLINTSDWNNNAGAVTFGNGVTGVAGMVSSANSLIGNTGDQIGSNGVFVLTNGNYVVSSPAWNSGLGAATFGSGTSGVVGSVLASNSLVGSNSGDGVGNQVAPLSNGNYAVLSSNWDGNRGAVTWGDGTVGTVGAIDSGTNSTVGANAGDQVGFGLVAVLQGPNSGNFVAPSPSMQNPAGTTIGKVVWFSGTTASTGTLQATNGIQGSANGDRIGEQGVTALTNGNYVVASPFWINGSTTNAGAATWADGSGRPLTNVTVSAANSLVGTTTGDLISSFGVTALTNGNFVIASPSWHNSGVANAGAATWGNGANGKDMNNTFGPISTANSLVGTTTNDRVSSSGITPLLNTNGDFVVSSEQWNDFRGAATWGNGMTGMSATISAANSLVGTSPFDTVASGVAVPLVNGDYVVSSFNWDSAIGAATWSSGSGTTVGAISAVNSLIGSVSGDNVGNTVFPLTNGNYVILSFSWNNSTGAVTWGDKAGATVGPVTITNSLVGSIADDSVGSGVLIELSNGDYAFGSPVWTNGISPGGPFTLAGAATIAIGTGPSSGPLTLSNSLVGLSDNAGLDLIADDSVNKKFYGGWLSEEAPTSLSGPSGIVRWGQYGGVVPVPSVVVVNLASGRAKYATAMSEAFGLWTDLKWGQYFNIDLYPPMYTPKNLNQKMLHLIYSEQPLKVQVARSEQRGDRF